jgi:hypothetical protein
VFASQKSSGNYMFTFIKPHLVILLGLAMSLSTSAWANESNAFKVTFNGLDISIDPDTGSLLMLSSPATGVILHASPESAGLVDLAYPVDSYTPMRLASRFSRANLAQEKNAVVITWEALGPSRSNFTLPSGKVYVQVTIRPASDRSSVIMTCRIENKSAVPVPQILFPDLWGLKPFAGMQETHLRLARGVEQPFTEPFKQPDSAPFYAAGNGWKFYSTAGGYYAENALRWLDFGGLGGGLSIFQKKWGSEDRPELITHRTEQDPVSLRLAWEHKHTVEVGQTWESGEFWFTPHPGGWAKGIEVYHNYVAQANPPRPLPTHVRDGLGFQTVFLTQDLERDPAKTYFRFGDLPRVALDASQHGIDEVVFWHASPAFVLPIPLGPPSARAGPTATYPVGTREELVEGIHKAKELGVNMAPFISIHEVLNRDAERLYGLKPGGENWTFHTELIPNFQPYYVKGYESTWVPVDNKAWQKNVFDALTDRINGGMYSFSWDQFGIDKGDAPKIELLDLIDKARGLARAKDPESTFSGESIDADSLEVDGRVLDYTWNWLDYVDAGPILNVLRAPRLNCNVEDSTRVVKQAFSDGLYVNVMPRKQDEENGSALISSQPDMAKALKDAASLRKQFLPFFVNGTFIGDSVLSKRTSAFVRGYTLDNKLLIIVLNDQDKAENVTVNSDLGLWLPSTRSYVSQYYDSDGKLVRTARGTGQRWSGGTDLLQPNELVLFEIDAQ